MKQTFLDVGDETIAGRVRLLRVQSGKSRTTLARKAGVSDGWLSNLEQGRITKPDLTKLAKLALALGTNVDTLLDAAGYTPAVEAMANNIPPLPDDVRLMLNRLMALCEAGRERALDRIAPILAEESAPFDAPNWYTLRPAGLEPPIMPAHGGPSGALLRKLRIEHRLNMGELAHMAGVHASTLGNIERGKHKLSWEIADRLAPVFGMTRWAFLAACGDDIAPERVAWFEQQECERQAMLATVKAAREQEQAEQEAALFGSLRGTQPTARRAIPTITTEKETADDDPLIGEAMRIIRQANHASPSLLQRNMRINFKRASGLIHTMERQGLISQERGA